jgi:hypothetical protein
LGVGLYEGSPAVASPIYRRADANCCPTGGYALRTYRWVGRRLSFVNRLHLPKVPGGFDFRLLRDG